MSRLINNPKYIAGTLGLVLLIATGFSCNKTWLDAKPSSGLVVLNSLDQIEGLLDNTPQSNALLVVGGDDYYVPANFELSQSVENVNLYIWAIDGYGTTSEGNWSVDYNAIFSANTAIMGLGSIARTSENGAEWDQVYGTALFIRAYMYYGLSQLYIKPYDSATAASDPGVPIRLVADITQKVNRGTVQQVYDRVLSDLNRAATLLPTTEAYFSRPTKATAYAMLARTYLSMGAYAKAKTSADTSLQQTSILLDFNTLSPTPTATLGMPAYNTNPEVTFLSDALSGLTTQTNARVDTLLYQLYDPNDLRQAYFFLTKNPGHPFRGTYDGLRRNDMFCAPATDEVYLIRAESNIRIGNVSAGLSDLNTLLTTRYITNTFTPYLTSDPDSALRVVITERRKELIFRGTRWTDLRRLNKDPRFTTTVTRFDANGTPFTLLPNSNTYVWPLPDDEILYSGIAQNPR